MHVGGKQLYFAKPEFGYHFNVFIESVNYGILNAKQIAKNVPHYRSRNYIIIRPACAWPARLQFLRGPWGRAGVPQRETRRGTRQSGGPVGIAVAVCMTDLWELTNAHGHHDLDGCLPEIIEEMFAPNYIIISALEIIF